MQHKTNGIGASTQPIQPRTTQDHPEEDKSTLHVLVLEGLPADVREAINNARTAFGPISEESLEGVARHRAWFGTQTGAFPSPVPPGHMATAIRLETRFPESIEARMFEIEKAKRFLDECRKTLSIGYAFADRSGGPEACAAIITGAVGEKEMGGDTGCLGTSRRSTYFGVLQHLLYGGNFNKLMYGLGTGQVVGDVPCPHRIEFDEKTSPLRMQFHGDDPMRHGWGLNLGTSEATEGLIKGGELPGPGFSMSVLLSFLDSLVILLRGSEHRIFAHVDPDGQLMISGFELFAAGIIDKAFKPESKLTLKECREYELGDPPTEAAAMVALLKMHFGLLSDAIEHFRHRPGTDELLRRLKDNLRATFKWLVEHGEITVPDRLFSTGSASPSLRTRSFVN